MTVIAYVLQVRTLKFYNLSLTQLKYFKQTLDYLNLILIKKHK